MEKARSARGVGGLGQRSSGQSTAGIWCPEPGPSPEDRPAVKGQEAGRQLGPRADLAHTGATYSWSRCVLGAHRQVGSRLHLSQ